MALIGYSQVETKDFNVEDIQVTMRFSEYVCGEFLSSNEFLESLGIDLVGDDGNMIPIVDRIKMAMLYAREMETL